MVVQRHPNLVVNAPATGPHIAGTETNSDPIHAVRLLVSPKTMSSSVKRTPNEKPKPSAIIWATKDAATTAQPQPPSGASVSEASTRDGGRSAAAGANQRGPLLPRGFSLTVSTSTSAADGRRQPGFVDGSCWSSFLFAVDWGRSSDSGSILNDVWCSPVDDILPRDRWHEPRTAGTPGRRRYSTWRRRFGAFPTTMTKISREEASQSHISQGQSRGTTQAPTAGCALRRCRSARFYVSRLRRNRKKTTRNNRLSPVVDSARIRRYSLAVGTSSSKGEVSDNGFTVQRTAHQLTRAAAPALHCARDWLHCSPLGLHESSFSLLEYSLEYLIRSSTRV